MDHRHPESISDALQAVGLDNFSVASGLVRIGGTFWRSVDCSCARPDCEGWALELVPATVAQERQLAGLGKK